MHILHRYGSYTTPPSQGYAQTAQVSLNSSNYLYLFDNS